MFFDVNHKKVNLSLSILKYTIKKPNRVLFFQGIQIDRVLSYAMHLLFKILSTKLQNVRICKAYSMEYFMTASLLKSDIIYGEYRLVR